MSYAYVILAWLLTPLAVGQTAYTVSTVAGANSLGDGGRATSASFVSIEGVAADSLGNVYISDAGDHRIRRVSPSGVITTVAGSSSPGLTPDDTPAAQALLNSPYGIAMAAAGHLYYADFGNRLVRCIGASGLVRTVAGGTEVIKFAGPRNVAVDGTGAVIFSDYEGHRVYRVSGSDVTAFAGNGTAGFDSEPVAARARLRSPAGVAVDSLGYVYIADSGNGLVRRVFGGQISTFAGGAGDAVTLDTPTAVTADGAGNIFILDLKRKRVYRRSRIGDTRVVAADVAEPRDIAADPAGNLYIAEARRVFRLTPSGQLSLHAGQPDAASLPEDSPAANAALSAPIHVSLDAAGNLYVTEERGRRVRRINQAGLIRTMANGQTFADPVASVMDPRGVLRVADYAGNRIYSIAPDGKATVIAGDGTAGFRGDNALATGSRVNRPRELVLDRAGNLIFADSLNHRVRRIGVNGVITTIAGTGTRGFSGDGRLATQAQLNTPQGVFLDPAGVLFIADSGNHRIRRVAANGLITTVAGNGSPEDAGDGAPALQAALNSPSSVAMDPAGALLIADTFNHKVRRVTPDGIIETIAGDGTPGNDGDGEPSLAARFRFPTSIAVDPAGAIYVADHENQRIRKLIPAVPEPLVEPEPAPVALFHAASLASGPFAPGQLVIARPGDARIMVNDRPVVPVSSSREQVSFVLPAGRNEVRINQRAIPLERAAPGIFAREGVGQAVAINEDNSLNSEENPAARGSVLAFYLTGEGPDWRDTVEVTVGQARTEVLFAGPVAAFPGVFQVNVRLPGIFTPPGVRALTVSVAGVASQAGVTVAVR